MAIQLKDKEFDRFFKRLGQKIRQLRTQKGMTQEDMLSYGFSTRHYQRIEAGLPINIKTALRLCKAFGLDLSKLFADLD